MINFKLNGCDQVLNPGEAVYSPPNVIYRDAPADLISTLVERVKKGEPWKTLIRNEIEPKNNWLAKIIMCDKRNDFLELIPEYQKEYIALDVGAGWGQHTVDISKNGRVCSIEPSPERFEFMRAICAQEGTNDRCYFVNSSLWQTEFESLFDFAVSIGVLEWVGKFEPCERPRNAQINFLKSIKKAIKPGAPLVLGIENRLGLKYLLGSNDDHIGVPYVSCMEYDDANSRWRETNSENLKVVTYSLKEYILLFEEAGFSDLIVFSALPDYKIPNAIVECYPNDRLSKFLMEEEAIEEHDGSNGKVLKNGELLASLYKGIAREGIAAHFSPSYFIVAR